MKWETPALASVSSREPAPIQKPMATERTPGTRSEMTRSPESSSERTYFCTGSLLRVGLQEPVHEVVDLLEGELRRRVRVEHGRVVGVLEPAGERRLDGQLLDVDVGADEGRQLRRQLADGLGGDSSRIGQAGHLDAAGRQVVDQPV